MERFGITVSGQTLELVRFAAVGVALGVWYDLFRLLRLLLKPPVWRVFLADVLFFATAAVWTQLAALPICQGAVRPVHLAAMAVGFAVYYHTVGRVMYGIARQILGLVRRIFKKVLQNFKKRLQVEREV